MTGFSSAVERVTLPSPSASPPEGESGTLRWCRGAPRPCRLLEVESGAQLSLCPLEVETGTQRESPEGR